MTFPAKTIVDIIPDLDLLWEKTMGETDIKIAIIDGAVNRDHPVLKKAKLEILNTYTGMSTDLVGASAQHGTHITSIIFGQHESGVKGIAPNCSGLILPVFHDDSNGNTTPCSQLDLARLIQRAVEAGANIINISGGELNNSGKAHPILDRALRYCQDKNVLVVAAAGNDGCACLHIPSALPFVLAVGGMDEQGKPLKFSNWGAAYRTHGILAPAENIPGAFEGNETGLRTGTSFATAIVSGIAALLLSIQKKQGLKPDPAMVRKALLDGADGCTDWQKNVCQRLLKGRINIKKTYSKIHYNKIQIMEELHPNQAPVTIPELPPEITSDSPAGDVTPSGIHSENPHIKEPPLVPVVAQQTPPELGVMPSCGGKESCSCSNKKAAQPAQMAYALGSLGYDLVSEARRDSIAQHIEGGNPNDPAHLLKYLEKNSWDASSVTWTLNSNATPIYAIRPYGSFAAEGYKRLQEFLSDQIKVGADRISIPGIIAGQTRLMSGQVVPVIIPELRCMYNWDIAALLTAVLGKPTSKGNDKRLHEQQKSAVANFLERVYHDLQNLGTSPQERAINFAATNALNVANIFAEALKDNMQLDTIEVERSSVCRMGSDCWDVLLTFFDPEKQLVRARKVYRLTIDVSDVCPVMVGAVRSWAVR